jgi:hypothetical protein
MTDALSDGYIVGFSLFSVVQLLRIERKTCELQIESPDGRTGILAFAGGNLVHAVSGGQDGEDAVYELLGWADALIWLRATPPRQTQTIHRPLTQVLMSAVRLQDGTDAAGVDPDDRSERYEPEVALAAVAGGEGPLLARMGGTSTLGWPATLWPDPDSEPFD